MSVDLHWSEIALRLVLTIAAGGLLGMERSKTGHPAGLRTTLLVTLAASIAMIQMNLLLPTNGKPPDSYAVMDLMRLPLGILTGVGFIGAGAIIHKNELVLGITTAATMWFATVVGLCMGGGQLILGSTSTIIGFLILWGVRFIEGRAERYQLAELKIVMEGDGLSPNEVRDRLQSAEFRIKTLSLANCVKAQLTTFNFQVRWLAAHGTAEIPQTVSELRHLPGMVEVEWSVYSSGPQ